MAFGRATSLRTVLSPVMSSSSHPRAERGQRLADLGLAQIVDERLLGR
jgi:hypothetical protein